MVLKGLLAVVSGFAFIFSSGIPMRMISRFRPDYKKEGLYWGIGIWMLAFIISTFLQALARQFISGGPGILQVNAGESSLFPYLMVGIFKTLLLQIGMLIFLKSRLKKGEDISSDGLALGFGIGLIAQIFTGMTLIGAGAGLVFQGAGMQLAEGTVQAGAVAMIANTSLFSLLSALISMILYRVANLTVSSVQGYMVANSLVGRSSWFWLGILVTTTFTWGILFVQLALGQESPGQILGVTSPVISVLSSLYYLATFILGFRWLKKQLETSSPRKK